MKPFDNSSQQSSYRELREYFASKSTKTARLTVAILKAAETGQRLSYEDLDKISGSHRYGGLAHEIRNRYNVTNTVDKVPGIGTVYTFSLGDPAPVQAFLEAKKAKAAKKAAKEAEKAARKAAREAKKTKQICLTNLFSPLE